MTTRPTFQGSETSSVEVTIYPQMSDPVLNRDTTAIVLNGLASRTYTPSVVSVATHKDLGQVGTWTVELKVPRDTQLASRLLNVMDDDWVDIVFLRHGVPHHVMRGLVDELRTSQVASGDGAEVTTIVLSGRDFTKVWDATPIFFWRYSADEHWGVAHLQVFSKDLPRATPQQVVDGILRRFLAVQAAYSGRAKWRLPQSLNQTQPQFLDAVDFEYDASTDLPERTVSVENFLDPDGAGAWAYAMEWADPQFCELHADLWGPNGAPGPGEALPASDSRMVLSFRGVPFPTAADGSAWAALPVHTVPRQAVASLDVGRSGFERINAVFMGMQIDQEVGARVHEIILPTWNLDDMARRGIRRIDVTSRYVPATNLQGFTVEQAARLRDWFALNPYFLNGSVVLARGFPEIRCGTRFRVSGDSPDQDQTYYVESVDHTWRLGPGMRTTLGVTRGWVGTDASLSGAIASLAASYVQADFDGSKATAAAFAAVTETVA